MARMDAARETSGMGASVTKIGDRRIRRPGAVGRHSRRPNRGSGDERSAPWSRPERFLYDASLRWLSRSLDRALAHFNEAAPRRDRRNVARSRRGFTKVAHNLAQMETASEPRSVTMEEITALAKRRGFVFQSSEIYGGINGFWDYGPLGAILKQNVKRAWWRDTVELRDDVVAFDSSIIMHPSVWKASGHIDAFHDVMIDCKVCKHRFRADHLKDRSQCPDCGSKGSFTEPRNFNLMMRTAIGPMEDTSSQAYLRPETAQGIFVNFKNIYQSARKRPPFGVAQIGKSFRN